MFKPSSLTLDTTSIAFLFRITRATSASFLAKKIRISLHSGSFNWNLLLSDLTTSWLTECWIVLSWFLAMRSAIVLPSTYFHFSLVLLVSLSSIIKMNNQGPSFVSCGTPTSFHSCPTYANRGFIQNCMDRFKWKTITPFWTERHIQLNSFYKAVTELQLGDRTII